MTLKELKLVNPWNMDFMDLITYLKRNRLTIEQSEIDFSPTAMVFRIIGFTDNTDAVLHIILTDAISEDEDFYDELYDFAVNNEWELLDGHVKKFFILGYSEADSTTITNTDFGIEDSELFKMERRYRYEA